MLGKRLLGQRGLTFVMILSSVALAGCVPDNSEQLAALQKRTDDLQTQIKTLKDSIDQLKADQSWDKVLRDSASTAYLTPGNDGYSVIETDLGHLTVQLANVQSYANGTRITLRFGNLSSATINGAKATLEWGQVDEKGNPKNDDARSRDVTFGQSLRAGAWTNVQVVLEGVPAQQFGFIRVSNLTHTGIELLK